MEEKNEKNFPNLYEKKDIEVASNLGRSALETLVDFE
jgi:hypothetical protein